MSSSSEKVQNFSTERKLNTADFSLLQGFGMTESSPVTHFQPAEGAILGGCGVPVPNTIAKIIDIDTGRALGPNEVGELCVAGPQVMKGYYKNDKATKSTVIDGWLHTGDIARYDEGGQFFIVDRLKELIKVKGLQVRHAYQLSLAFFLLSCRPSPIFEAEKTSFRRHLTKVLILLKRITFSRWPRPNWRI